MFTIYIYACANSGYQALCSSFHKLWATLNLSNFYAQHTLKPFLINHPLRSMRRRKCGKRGTNVPVFLSGTCFSAPFVHQQPTCLTHEENTSALCGKIKGGRGPRSEHNLYMAWKVHAWPAHLHCWHFYKNQLTLGPPLWTMYSNHCLIRARFFWHKVEC